MHSTLDKGQAYEKEKKKKKKKAFNKHSEL